MKLEYMIIEIHRSMDRWDIEERLNELGQLEWEVTTSYDEGFGHRVFILKRTAREVK